MMRKGNIFNLYILIFFIVFSFLDPETLQASLNLPDISMNYLNPYELLRRPPMEDSGLGRWIVVSNRKNAPIYSRPSKSALTNRRAGWLEVFHVEAVKVPFIKVRTYYTDSITNTWMHVLDLIALPTSITNPATRVRLKAFLRIRMGVREQQEEQLASLRFRNGPGKAGEGNPYDYTYRRDQVPGVGTMFYYVYGVFNENFDTDDYFNISEMRGAKFFLLGLEPGMNFEIEKIGSKGRLKKDIILGWVPRTGAALWDTRQALEVVPDRKENWAHIFKKATNLREFFTKNKDQKEIFLSKIAEDLVRDTGQGPPESGSELRYLVLKEPLHFEKAKTKYALIGHSGRNDSGGEGSPVNLPQPGSRLHFSRDDVQQGGKYLDLFFLIDATRSMKPALEAAALVSRGLINEIQENLIKKNIEITVQAALYRDQVDEKNSERFVICPYSRPGEVADWLAVVEAKNASGDNTYEESLYYGIEKAIKYWRSKFSHGISTRVIVIIGDAGDDGGGPSMESLASLMRENLVLPLAIHFNLPPRNESEKKAINKFPDHMSEIIKTRWGQDLIPVQPIFDEKNRKIAQREEVQRDLTHGILNNKLKSIGSTVSRFISEIAFNRLGMKSFRDIICELAFDRDEALNKECRECGDESSIIAFIQQHALEGPQIVKAQSDIADIDIGFALAMLKQLNEICPDCFAYLLDKPYMGFDTGHIATTVKNYSLTRPVLLLSYEELEDLLNKCRYIASSFCDPTKNYRLVLDALATIIGEALQVDPHEIPKSIVKEWFDIVVEPGKTFLVDDLAKGLCRNRKRWLQLRKQLKIVPLNIKNIRGRASSKYTDANGLPYYWVHPEEIFPPLTK